MGKSFSSDLRIRVAGLVGQGASARGTARHHRVSASFAGKLIARLRAKLFNRSGRNSANRINTNNAAASTPPKTNSRFMTRSHLRQGADNDADERKRPHDKHCCNEIGHWGPPVFGGLKFAAQP